MPTKKITTEDKVKVLTDLVNEMFRVEPLPNFVDPAPKTEIEHRQKAALARMYADSGFRSYLQDAVNRSIYAAAMNAEDMASLIFSRAKIKTLKELLSVAERSFKDIDATMARARIDANNEEREESLESDAETVRL